MGSFQPLAAGVWHMEELRGPPCGAQGLRGAPGELGVGGGGSHQLSAQLLS